MTEISSEILPATAPKPKLATMTCASARIKRSEMAYIAFWVGPCCTDKTNNIEVSGAIKSMFRWYCEANRCYLYLLGVSLRNVEQSGLSASLSWESEFCAGGWFTRTWALQELVAPRAVQCFAHDGTPLINMVSLHDEVTGIPTLALLDKT